MVPEIGPPFVLRVSISMQLIADGDVFLLSPIKNVALLAAPDALPNDIKAVNPSTVNSVVGLNQKEKAPTVFAWNDGVAL